MSVLPPSTAIRLTTSLPRSSISLADIAHDYELSELCSNNTVSEFNSVPFCVC